MGAGAGCCLWNLSWLLAGSKPDDSWSLRGNGAGCCLLNLSWYLWEVFLMVAVVVHTGAELPLNFLVLNKTQTSSILFSPECA